MIAAGALLVSAALEARYSWIETAVFPVLARRQTYSVQAGPSHALARPAQGPYDERLGLAQLPRFERNLEAHGYKVTEQARDSRLSRGLALFGMAGTYPEKSQAGLLILDRHEQPLYHVTYPHQIYPNFHSIPPLVVKTLLFIENREMLDRSHPERNPAIQWGRLGRAVADVGIHAVDRAHPVIGGSTLATQLEKIRHSPGGRTSSLTEKARQMLSASLRAYRNGPNTIRAQEQVICDYVNSIPLAATPGGGEVIGLADGFREWYGANVATVDRLLTAQETNMTPRQLDARARAYREALSLLLALHAPTRTLVHQPELLDARVDRYLRALADEKIISVGLCNRALLLNVSPHISTFEKPEQDFVKHKASDAIRMGLLAALGLDNTYALDRLDLSVRTTLDQPTQNAVSGFLASLSTPDAIKAASLDADQLLDRGKPGAVIYSVTLYERGKDVNLLRVQTDNYNQPLDINEGTRLQLGSTAKLRTMINYLQIIEDLHHQYAGLSAARLQKVHVKEGDVLTQWAIDYLSSASDRGLEPMLVAALNRKYSGNPGEAFFTAGGLHHFDNFERTEDSSFFTVAEGLQKSVNLVYIRLMRDIERYYMFRVPGATPKALNDLNDPARRRYLERFADYEGGTFLRHFFEKYQGKTADQALDAAAASVTLTPLRAAVIFRSVRPKAGLLKFEAFLRAHLPIAALAREDAGELYEKYGPDKFNLNDRGYLAHVHPLELWLLNYKEQHPNARFADILAKSAPARQEVYQWLFKSRYKHAQDKRIETLMEIDAFKEIHRAWKQLGYPFDSLTPSYATCIGVSGDTPRALADLVGILLNDGVRYPSVRVRELHFAKGTPLETVLTPQTPPGVRVLSPVIAKLVRQQMIGVVENGTARRLSGGMTLPDGQTLAIGGKTGTGDNRLEEFGARGGLIASRVVNRTAVFAFFIGDRFYGTALAFVPGQAAAGYNFTSALAVQVVKDLEPRIAGLVQDEVRSQGVQGSSGPEMTALRREGG